MQGKKLQNKKENTDVFRFEVSVLLLTYNSCFEKIKSSILSVIEQKNVRLELVIADDGSQINSIDEIESLLSEYSFRDYKVIINKENGGTVKNYLSALNEAEGKYSKTVSPGDYLVSDHILHDWVEYMESVKYSWSFSDAIYYKGSLSAENIISVEARPRDIAPYISQNDNECRWNYCVFDDIAVGATMIGLTHLIKEYCERIKAAGILLAEDNLYRLLMFEGQCGGYYPSPTIYYEYGSGVSTTTDSPYIRQLHLDWNKTDMLMENSASDSFQIKMLEQKALLSMPKKKWLVHGKIRQAMLRRIKHRMTLNCYLN